jgi:hypothetical protein
MYSMGVLAAVLYFELYPVLRYLFCKLLLERSSSSALKHFTESLSIHTRGIPYFFLEGAEHLWLFFLHLRQVFILIFQLLVLSEWFYNYFINKSIKILSEQLSIFLSEIPDFSLLDFDCSFEKKSVFPWYYWKGRHLCYY